MVLQWQEIHCFSISTNCLRSSSVACIERLEPIHSLSAASFKAGHYAQSFDTIIAMHHPDNQTHPTIPAQSQFPIRLPRQFCSPPFQRRSSFSSRFGQTPLKFSLNPRNYGQKWEPEMSEKSDLKSYRRKIGNSQRSRSERRADDAGSTYRLHV